MYISRVWDDIFKLYVLETSPNLSLRARHFYKIAKVFRFVKMVRNTFLWFKLKNMANKKIHFRLPPTIQHQEVKSLMSKLVKELNDKEQLTTADIPQLHRMATAYDTYLTCVEVIADKGITMRNLKGEEVKRPEVNIQKESWAQYLELAKEYGLTKKSKRQMKASGDETDKDSPIRAFV